MNTLAFSHHEKERERESVKFLCTNDGTLCIRLVDFFNVESSSFCTPHFNRGTFQLAKVKLKKKKSERRAYEHWNRYYRLSSLIM